MITCLPARDRVAVPWKNGGGVTREVCVSPAGAGMAAFDWRISMAEVTQAGPFSSFDTIDRHLTVLGGRLELAFDDRTAVLGSGDSLAFAGEATCHGTPLDGPVTDLNVMTRRGRVTASVRRVSGEVAVTAATAFLIDLASLDALHLDNESVVTAQFPSLLIEIF